MKLKHSEKSIAKSVLSILSGTSPTKTFLTKLKVAQRFIDISTRIVKYELTDMQVFGPNYYSYCTDRRVNIISHMFITFLSIFFKDPKDPRLWCFRYFGSYFRRLSHMFEMYKYPEEFDNIIKYGYLHYDDLTIPVPGNYTKTLIAPMPFTDEELGILYIESAIILSSICGGYSNLLDLGDRVITVSSKLVAVVTSFIYFNRRMFADALQPETAFDEKGKIVYDNAMSDSILLKLSIDYVGSDQFYEGVYFYKAYVEEPGVPV